MQRSLVAAHRVLRAAAASTTKRSGSAALRTAVPSLSPSSSRFASSPSSYRPSSSSSSSALLDRIGSLRASSSSKDDDEKSAAMSTVFKPWPTPAVESSGDYREEAYLETLIGGPLYRNQSSLPRLPIPDVNDTLKKLVPTCLPLAESKEERDRFLKLCEELPERAEELQRRLRERRDGEMKDSSWLQLWWNTEGYLKIRDPVVVNVSYFFHLSDDGTLPQPTHEADSAAGGGSAALGIKRGAATLYAAAEYRKSVCSGSLPCESIGRKEPKTPLCSVAFKYMFNACRIPRREMDAYRMYDPSLHSHAIVARKGRFYAVDFADPTTAEPLPLSVLEDRLRRVVELADAEAATKGDGGLGWLTSSDRDSWADAREEILRVGGKDAEEALEELESGALMICLDDEEPISKRQCASLFWTGTLTSGHNRWFDKSLQFMVTNNGKAGFIGEHSMMDGMPVVGLMDHVTKTTYREALRRSSASAGGAGVGAGVDEEGAVRDIFGRCSERLTSGDSKVGIMVKKAKADFHSLVGAHDLDVQSFRGYGSTYIKSIGFSPDAFVQVAIQLATYRLWGKQGATYEATQMRPFLHGRTETTRGVSAESEAFVRRMGLRPTHDEDEEGARKEKLALLRGAVDAHVKYIGSAAKGAGVDRHLLGLAMCVEDGEDVPGLYSDPLYTRSKSWRVSTSHLTHPKFDGWGYGEVVPDGVGLAYMIQADGCNFNITARNDAEGGEEGRGWTERLSYLLEEALIEMQILNEMDKSPVSRL